MIHKNYGYKNLSYKLKIIRFQYLNISSIINCPLFKTKNGPLLHLIIIQRLEWDNSFEINGFKQIIF